MAQAQSDVVAAQKTSAVHRAHVGRRCADHFDETTHGRGARRAGQRISSLATAAVVVVAASRGRVCDRHLPMRGGQRRSERRRRKRFLRTIKRTKHAREIRSSCPE